MIGLPLLLATHRAFPLTPLRYRLLAACVGLGLLTGAARPRPQALRPRRSRHAGLRAALLARDILLRRSPLRPGKWQFFTVTAIGLAVSAFYELIEWWTALAGGASAEAFLGTQGDVWDTQWDMFIALIGALASQMLLSRPHDRQLARLSKLTPRTATPAAQ